MKHFLNILLRDQFRLFYRFGYTFLPKSSLIEFEGHITHDVKDAIVKQFARAAPFEYEEEYLIIHFQKSLSYEEFIFFEIQDIVTIYPLSERSKSSIELKIDQRIKLENPIFEIELPRIEFEIEKKEIENAISALWIICKIDVNRENFVSTIGTENIFKGIELRRVGAKADKIIGKNYWECLLAYDRFDYFPNSTLGYFYDAGQVFAFSKGLTTFEGSDLYKLLEHLNVENSTIKFPEIIRQLETDERSKKYISQTTLANLKLYIIAPLYLMLRNEIRKSDELTQTRLFKNLDYLKTFGDNFYCTVILLGAFFGFRKFYDSYYDALNLRFFKKRDALVIDQKSNINKLKLVDTSDIILEGNAKDSVLNESFNINTLGEFSQSISLNQYFDIINKTFSTKLEIKLTELTSMINTITGHKLKSNMVVEIINKIPELEIISKRNSKLVRRKAKSTNLFN
ncbi:hypothetical protein GCM10028807_34480 [Spirosoma daeguense]